jgi:Holliday junction resolvasome RuvABC endonuclease subunit
MIIIGIDPGSKFLGYSVINSDSSGYKILDKGFIVPSTKKTIDEEGYALIASSLNTLFKKYKVDECVIERYVTFQQAFRRSNAFVVPNVVTIIRLIWFLYSNKKPKLPTVSQWKSIVLEKPRADKKEIKEYILKNNILSDKEKQDVYDATCIAIYGHFVFNKPQSEIIKVFRKNSKVTKKTTSKVTKRRKK